MESSSFCFCSNNYPNIGAFKRRTCRRSLWVVECLTCWMLLTSTVRISDGTRTLPWIGCLFQQTDKNEQRFFELQQKWPIRIQDSVVEADSFKILPPRPCNAFPFSGGCTFEKVAWSCLLGGAMNSLAKLPVGAFNEHTAQWWHHLDLFGLLGQEHSAEASWFSFHLPDIFHPCHSLWIPHLCCQVRWESQELKLYRSKFKQTLSFWTQKMRVYGLLSGNGGTDSLRGFWRNFNLVWPTIGGKMRKRVLETLGCRNPSPPGMYKSM